MLEKRRGQERRESMSGQPKKREENRREEKSEVN